MLDRGRVAAVLALALVACRFDGGGVSSDDVDAAGDDVPDGPPGDRDADGVRDDLDNCPDDGNPAQEDEDTDTVGNVCDNCPHVSNADQANQGETGAGVARDGAGDACDPDPAATGNDILLFDGFDDPSALQTWGSFGGGSWTISGGALRQSSTAGTHAAYLSVLQFQSAVVDTRITVDVLPGPAGAGDLERGIATLLAFSSAPDQGAGYTCFVYTDPNLPTPPTGTLFLTTLRGSFAFEVEGQTSIGANVAQGASYNIRQRFERVSNEMSCDLDSTAIPAPVSVTGSDANYDGGLLGIRTSFLSAHADYIVVFSVAD